MQLCFARYTRPGWEYLKAFVELGKDMLGKCETIYLDKGKEISEPLFDISELDWMFLLVCMSKSNELIFRMYRALLNKMRALLNIVGMSKSVD